MTIQKGEKEYTVTERKDSWAVTSQIGKVRLTYEIPKSICEDAESLKEYVNQETLF